MRRARGRRRWACSATGRCSTSCSGAPAPSGARPLEEQTGWAEHAAFMDGLVDAGFILLGRRLADGVRVVHAVEADSGTPSGPRSA